MVLGNLGIEKLKISLPCTHNNNYYSRNTIEKKEAITVLKEEFAKVSYSWQIQGITACVKQITDTSFKLTSPVFEVGGYKWLVRFYPMKTKQGLAKEFSTCNHCPGLYLHIEYTHVFTDAIRIKRRFRLKDPLGSKDLDVPGGKDHQTKLLVYNSNNTSWGFRRLDGSKFTTFQMLQKFVGKDDTLTIECEVSVLFPLVRQSSYMTRDAKDKQIYSFLADPLFSDVIIATEPPIQAHRIILAARSPVFRAMLTIPLLESKERVIQLPGVEYATVKCLLDYLYGGKVSMDSISLATKVYELADKFECKGVKTHCVKFIESKLTAESVIDAIQFADLYKLPDLKEKARKIMSTNPMACLSGYTLVRKPEASPGGEPLAKKQKIEEID
jgi:hypothetical protein